MLTMLALNTLHVKNRLMKMEIRIGTNMMSWKKREFWWIFEISHQCESLYMWACPMHALSRIDALLNVVGDKASNMSAC